jgi:hypothetical protein
MRKLFLIGAAALAAVTSAGLAAPPVASAWLIGPIIKGRNYSPGMPLHPTPSRDGSWFIDLPEAPGSVHYVTFRHGSLEGKRRIVFRYRLETSRGTQVVATTDPRSPGIITPYFQRAGDNWSAKRQFETYRWYASFATRELTPGEHEMTVPLNGNWTAVMTSSAASNPAAFRDAIANAEQVGFVLGGGDGYGHGVHVNGRARLVVLDYRVE